MSILDSIKNIFKKQDDIPPKPTPINLWDLYDDDDDFDDGDVEEGAYEQLVVNDGWEDQVGMTILKEHLKIPNDWYLVRITGFDKRKMDEVDEWLKENCNKKYKRLGWASGCSSKVGVAIEDGMEAMFFKLRWQK
jgi:hypothetical protein